MVDWKETAVDAAGLKVRLRRGGSGPPLLVLHHDIGTLDRLPFYDALAERYDVLLPENPGYGQSERPTWMRSARDIAVLYRGLLADLDVAAPVLVGLGFGGWVAAEMASMAPRDLSALALVGPMGIKPADGFILDQALHGYVDYARAFFHDQKAFDGVYGEQPSTDQLVDWDICREMNFRIAWKPYMWSHTLAHLLGAVRVPALVAWGAEDKVVPVAAAEQWKVAMPAARIEIVPACGHAVEMEKPDVLAPLVIGLSGK